jgi:3-deoxy-D-manno-octulosonic-acid transferase
MGVPATRCFLTGSMKWDSAKLRASGPDGAAKVEGADELAADMGIDRARPVVVAGSTGPGEEALLRSALDRLPEGTQLVCAPRKPERFDEAAAALGPCVRRTEAVHNGVTGHQGTRFLLDTIGELRKAYALADVVVVGRSFGTQYGSDPIEPVALGKATVIGPSVSDFAAVVAALERGGGLRRATPETLAEVLSELLASQPARAALARAGAMAIQREQGASVRHAELLLDLATTRQRARM